MLELSIEILAQKRHKCYICKKNTIQTFQNRHDGLCNRVNAGNRKSIFGRQLRTTALANLNCVTARWSRDLFSATFFSQRSLKMHGHSLQCASNCFTILKGPCKKLILTKELRERKKIARAKSERWNRSQIQNALQISKVRVNQRRKGQKSLIALKLSDMKNNWQREIKMHSSPSP